MKHQPLKRSVFVLVALFCGAYVANAADGPKVKASGLASESHPAPSGITYSCKDSSVQLSVEGDWKKDPPEDASACCIGGKQGSWQLSTTVDPTYEWMGDANSSATTSTTLDTSSEGNKWAGCTATFTWECSLDSSVTTTTDEEADLEDPDTSIYIYPDGDLPKPPSYSPGTDKMDPISINGVFASWQSAYSTYVDRRNGTVSNVLRHFSYSSTDNVTSSDCGVALPKYTATEKVEATVTLEWGFFSASVMGSTETETSTGSEKDATPFVSWNLYRTVQMVTGVTGDFSGSREQVTTSFYTNGGGATTVTDSDPAYHTNAEYQPGGSGNIVIEWDVTQRKCCPTKKSS
jgi:hypothetical protein